MMRIPLGSVFLFLLFIFVTTCRGELDPCVDAGGAEALSQCEPQVNEVLTVGDDDDDDDGDDDDEPESADCSAISEHDSWSLCASGPGMCVGVFEDGAGCVEFCAAAGMICSEAWENMDGVCAADLSRPELNCSTGHFSDYCVCVDPGDCTPACENKSCGDDGCGGSCGACDVGASCVSGACELPYNSSSLFDALVGYGQGTTGGLGGSLCTVTNLNDAGSGSLRACAEASGKKWIQFALSGDLYLNSDIQMKSNKTIDGRDQKIRIFNKGLNISNRSNILVTNLIFKKGDSSDDNDAIRVRNGSQDVWIHHCSFSNYHDGLVDIKEGSTDITVSWSKFSNHDKVMLIGASVNDTMDEDIRVTLHHNWFKGTKQRHPRLRFGRVHAFNNYYDSWGDYGLGCSYKGQCFSENNVYEAGSNKKAVVHRVGSDSQNGKVRSEGDWRLNWAMIDEKDPGSVFDPAQDYTYNAENADNTLIQNIEAHAGWEND